MLICIYVLLASVTVVVVLVTLLLLFNVLCLAAVLCLFGFFAIELQVERLYWFLCFVNCNGFLAA